MEVAADAPIDPLALEEGDVLVLCTDGLWSLVGERELLDVVRTQTPAVACSDLIKIARERGGPDNITLQVLRFTPNGKL